MSDPSTPGPSNENHESRDSQEFKVNDGSELNDTSFQTAVLEFAASTEEDYLEEYAEDEAKQPEKEFGLEDVKEFLIDSGQDADNLSDEQIEFVTSVLINLHEKAYNKAKQMFENERREDEEGEKIRALKKKIESGEIELDEEITEKEKAKRAKAMANDMISKTKDPILKQQREGAMARFIEMIIPEYDQRGWTLPQNIFVEGSDERKRVRNDIVKKAKEGTGLM